jgi:ATP synthase protein I
LSPGTETITGPDSALFRLTSQHACVKRPAVDKETRKTAIQLASLSSIGIAMVIAVFGCFFLGRWLDRHFGTEPYLAFLLLIIGIAAGFRNIYVLLKRYVKNEKPIITRVKSEPRKRPPPEKA